jgi:hypothetical protein
LLFQGFPRIFQVVKYGHFGAAAWAHFRAGRGRFHIAVFCVCALSFAGCKENLSAPNVGLVPDTSGPLVQLHPAQDTLVDSSGTLLVRVDASDPLGVGMVLFNIQPMHYVIDPLAPNDTVFDGFFPITLGNYKHSTLKYWVVARDILDHETVTDTVTVTVR